MVYELFKGKQWEVPYCASFNIVEYRDFLCAAQHIAGFQDQISSFWSRCESKTLRGLSFQLKDQSNPFITQATPEVER